jgi:hypothetical protein
MSYSNLLSGLEKSLKDKTQLEELIRTTSLDLAKKQQDYVNLIDAQKVLSTVSDDNIEASLDFITGVINKALSEIFANTTRRVYITKKLYGNSKPHIILNLENGQGDSLDMAIQTGNGLCQVVSVLYMICLIEIRKGRRLVILDERLSGLHKEAKRILAEIIKIFTEGGFQFIFVEYSLNNIGKTYNIELVGDTAKAFPWDSEEDYSDDVVYKFSDVDTSVVDEGYIEIDEEEDLIGEVEIGK